MQNDIEDFLRPYNISHGRFSILLTLYAHLNDSVHPSQLSESLHKSRPTITGMLKKLLKDDLIDELPDPEDARGKKIQLNKKGYQLLGQIIPKYNHRIIEIGEKLNKDEKEQLLELINKISI